MWNNELLWVSPANLHCQLKWDDFLPSQNALHSKCLFLFLFFDGDGGGFGGLYQEWNSDWGDVPPAISGQQPQTTSIMSGCSQLQLTKDNKQGTFPTRGHVRGWGWGSSGSGIEGGAEGGAELSVAVRLYLQARAPEPGGCLTARRCPRCWSARRPPPTGAPGVKHARTHTHTRFCQLLKGPTICKIIKKWKIQQSL